MKLTRKQLIRIVSEVVVASDDAKAAASDAAEELEDTLRKDNPNEPDDAIKAAAKKLANDDVNEGFFGDMFGGGEKEQKRKRAEARLAQLKKAQSQGQDPGDYLRQERENNPSRQLSQMIDDTDSMVDQLKASETKEEKLARLYKELQRRRAKSGGMTIKESSRKSPTKEISLKLVDSAIVKCLKKEGGAAGMGMLVDAVKSLETKTKNLPAKLSSKAKIKKYIAQHDAVLTHKYKDIILIKGLPKAKLEEALEKVGFYKKYSYGLDDIPDKTKAHDDIIGHT